MFGHSVIALYWTGICGILYTLSETFDLTKSGKRIERFELRVMLVERHLEEAVDILEEFRRDSTEVHGSPSFAAKPHMFEAQVFLASASVNWASNVELTEIFGSWYHYILSPIACSLCSRIHISSCLSVKSQVIDLIFSAQCNPYFLPII